LITSIKAPGQRILRKTSPIVNNKSGQQAPNWTEFGGPEVQYHLVL